MTVQPPSPTWPLQAITEDGVYESSQYPLQKGGLLIGKVRSLFFHRADNGAMEFIGSSTYTIANGPYRRMRLTPKGWEPVREPGI